MNKTLLHGRRYVSPRERFVQRQLLNLRRRLLRLQQHMKPNIHMVEQIKMFINLGEKELHKIRYGE